MVSRAAGCNRPIWYGRVCSTGTVPVLFRDLVGQQDGQRQDGRHLSDTIFCMAVTALDGIGQEQVAKVRYIYTVGILKC